MGGLKARRVDLCGGKALAEATNRAICTTLIDVRENHPLEERALGGNRGRGATDAAGAENDDPHR
jgi:hypothetical protein